MGMAYVGRDARKPLKKRAFPTSLISNNAYFHRVSVEEQFFPGGKPGAKKNGAIRFPIVTSLV